MNKQEFLAALKAELSFISLEEREDAVKYYEEYFEDAGEDRESSILLELGPPKQLAEKILDDLGYTKDGIRKPGNVELKLIENLEEIEEVKNETENKDTGSKKITENISASADISQEQEKENKQEKLEYNTPRQNNSSNKILITVLLILSSPLWAPVFFGMCAVIIGLFCSFFALSISFFSVAIAGFAMILSGIGMIVYGIVLLFSSLFVAVSMIGQGFLLLGAGIILGYIFFRIAIFLFKWQFKITAKLFSIIGSAIYNMFSGRKYYNAA